MFIMKNDSLDYILLFSSLLLSLIGDPIGLLLSFICITGFTIELIKKNKNS